MVEPEFGANNMKAMDPACLVSTWPNLTYLLTATFSIKMRDMQFYFYIPPNIVAPVYSNNVNNNNKSK